MSSPFYTQYDHRHETTTNRRRFKAVYLLIYIPSEKQYFVPKMFKRGGKFSARCAVVSRVFE